LIGAVCSFTYLIKFYRIKEGAPPPFGFGTPS